MGREEDMKSQEKDRKEMGIIEDGKGMKEERIPS